MPPGQEGEEQAEDQQTKGGSASAAMTHLSYQAPVQEDPMIDDFVVPSFLQDSMDFDNSGEGMLTLHHSAQEGEAEQGQGQLPQIEAPAPSSRVGGDNQQMGEAAAMFFGSQCPSSLQVQFVPTVGNDMGFPGSQYAAMIPGMHSMPPQPPAPMRSKPVPAVYIGNGANLTREQRVARCVGFPLPRSLSLQPARVGASRKSHHCITLLLCLSARQSSSLHLLASEA